MSLITEAIALVARVVTFVWPSHSLRMDAADEGSSVDPPMSNVVTVEEEDVPPLSDDDAPAEDDEAPLSDDSAEVEDEPPLLEYVTEPESESEDETAWPPVMPRTANPAVGAVRAVPRYRPAFGRAIYRAYPVDEDSDWD